MWICLRAVYAKFQRNDNSKFPIETAVRDFKANYWWLTGKCRGPK